MSLLLLLSGLALTAPPPKAPNTEATVPTKRPPDTEIGETLYRQSCSSCHGASGRGDGPVANVVVGGVATLAGKVPDDDAGVPAVVDLILEGRGRMPAFSETIERGDARLLVLYLRDVLAGRVQAHVEKPALHAPDPVGDDDGR